MFRFRKTTSPKLLTSNPGTSVAGEVGFSNAAKSWSEHYDVLAFLVSVLREQAIVIKREESWLVHPESGFIFLPRLVQVQPLSDGGVRTTTTIQAHHLSLVPDGVLSINIPRRTALKTQFATALTCG